MVKVNTLFTINNWPCSDVTITLQNTAIVSERPQFFFEINESWYYMLNLPALHWGQKPKSKSQGQRDGSNLLIQYILWGPTNGRGPPTGGMGLPCPGTASCRNWRLGRLQVTMKYCKICNAISGFTNKAMLYQVSQNAISGFANTSFKETKKRFWLIVSIS